MIPSDRVKRRYTEARLVAFRNGFIRVDPLYVSHNGELVNLKTFPASVDSPFIHHEALHVRDDGAFLCHKRTVVSDNTKYLIEEFTIA